MSFNTFSRLIPILGDLENMTEWTDKEREENLNTLKELLSAAFDERNISKCTDDSSVTFSFTINENETDKRLRSLYTLAMDHAA